MSNQQTIDDLRQANQRLNADYAILGSKLQSIEDAILQKQRQRTAIFQQLNRAPSGSAQRRALDQQYGNLNREIQLLEGEKLKLGTEMANLDSQIQRIERQISTLESGGTINQPPPVTDTASPSVSEPSSQPAGEATTGDEALQATQDQLVAQQQQTAEPYTADAATGDEALAATQAAEQLTGDEALAATQQAEEASAARSIPNSQNPLNQAAFETPPDWRVRLGLSPNSDYLYNAPDPGILQPLRQTGGVIYPYLPQINVTYNASYDTQQITHSNYKFYSYQGSSIESINITGDFTAQSIPEANYLLAVIHFFRSATKMFYGQDENPSRGVPPPLLYLSGHGSYQFDQHPVVITSFAYNLPADVDYINAYPTGATVGVTGNSIATNGQTQSGQSAPNSVTRRAASNLAPGGVPPPPRFPKSSQMADQLTRVPTKISISLSLLPIITRYAVSNQFSLRDYASGKLLRGSKNPNFGGGAW